MADVALDTVPGAREIFRELDSADRQPVVYLVRGRSQTGKSTLLAQIRARLRARGVPLRDDAAALRPENALIASSAGELAFRQGIPRHDHRATSRDGARVRNTNLPRTGHARRAEPSSTRPGEGIAAPTPSSVGGTAHTAPEPHPALIVDNAHTLSQREIEFLCAAIESGECTVVVAAQPRPHHALLRTLADTVARRGRVIDLRPLGSTDLTPFARELGMMVPRRIAQHIHAQTAGSRGGVVAALTAACSARLEAGVAAVDAAVAGWARTLLDDFEPALLETLVVAATGTGLDATELTEVLGVEPEAARALIDRARASALVTDADLLLEPATGPLRTLLGDRRFLAVQCELLDARLEAGLLRDHIALRLAESGVRDPRLAEFLVAAAERDSGEAARYFAAASAAGADSDDIALRWAEAAARSGDEETAMRLAEPMLARPGCAVTEVAAAVRICATVLTRRGLIDRAAQLYSWLGAHRVGPDWAVGATVLYLAGDAPGALEMAASASQWPPTEANAHAGLIATALAESITEPEKGTASAVSALVQATRTSAERFPPCTPASIATLLCLAIGEPRRAGDALRRARDGGMGGPQLDVLAAWAAMLGGDERAAAATLTGVDHDALDIRDRLLAHGVAVGLARRSGDHTALVRAWQAAYPLFDDVQADLLSLLPVGELWLASIRLRDERRVAPLVDAALALLRRLGDPPAWSNAFHWYGVQAAIAHESPDDLLPHARALKSAAEAGDRHAAVLADAGRTWVLVLRGHVAAPAVQSAVAALTEIGLTWDGARLAGEAALATSDSATATTLLKLARTVRAEARPQETPQRPPAAGNERAEAPPAPAGPPSADMLSEREREVAELVLLGLTYREIGARLYISAKTVEHHVARIRRRIGARSRSELLSMLRAMGHGSLLV